MTKKCVGKMVLASVFGLAASALADNPISNYHYLADPAAAASDSVFYILTDTDDECPSSGDNDYTIRALYLLSSKDMKNWTDHGMVLQHDREVGYIKNIWAPGIAVHDGVFYLIYPNGASGVGIVASKDVAGPYTDPVGKLLVGGGGVTGCDGISWCFDPAIFIDDDGKSYMTFGGGSGGSRSYGNNFDLFEFSKLSHEKVELNVGSKTALQGANRSFEASYLHKRNGIYYLSYNDQSQNISYATSKNIKGPYSYQGTVIENPSKINGKGGNNHHGFAKFKDKWYAVYHDRRLVMDPEHPAAGGRTSGLTTGNHRSTSIDELTWNGDKMNVVKFTDAGPAQIDDFDPYQTYKALTSSKQKNVRSRTDYTKGQPVVHVLTPLASKESWIRVSGVNFGKGAEKFVVTAASVESGNKIEIHTGSASGTLAGTCELPKTGGWKSYEQVECDVKDLSNMVDQLFLVFKGSKDSTMGILEWGFLGSGMAVVTQTPYDSIPVKLPAVIEAELFDKGGARKGYSDDDAGNQGDAEFRADEGVDIVLGGTGKAIGYTNAGEWLEYTVEVAEDGKFPIVAYASSGAENSGFCFSVDGKPVGDTVKVTKTGEDWSVYKEFSAGTAELTKGTHEIRLTITGNNVNVDWFRFGEVKADTVSEAISASLKLNASGLKTYSVYDMKGTLVGSVDLRLEGGVSKVLKSAGFKPGVYVLRNAKGNVRFMTTVVE